MSAPQNAASSKPASQKVKATQKATPKANKAAQKAVIISAFACSGKTYFTQNAEKLGYTVLDLDSSNYGWTKDKDGKKVRSKTFAQEYIDDIVAKATGPKATNKTILLVSTHPEVRNVLPEKGLRYSLVYPKKALKTEWLDRMRDRGSPESLLGIFNDNWDSFIGQCKESNNCTHYTLGRGQYLSTIVDNILKHS